MSACNLSEALRKIVPRVGIPDRFLCGKCNLFLQITDELNTWLIANRMDLIDRFGSAGRLQPGVLTCHCREAEREEAARKLLADRERIFLANLPRRQDAVGPRTFGNFALSDGNRDMYAAVHEWADGQGAPVLVLIGSTGCGKTHLLEAACRYRLGLGDHARYDTPEALLNRLRGTFKERPGDDQDTDIEDLLGWYQRIPWLALDDLGQQKPTAWGADYFTRLVDQRYMDGSRTVLTTNHGTQREMARVWGDRLASRLFDTHSGVVSVIWTTAGDYRIHGS